MIIPFPNYMTYASGVWYRGRKYETVDDVLKTLAPDEAERMAACPAAAAIDVGCLSQ